MKLRTLLMIFLCLLFFGCYHQPTVKGVYRYFWGKKGGFNVWIVDGAVVRRDIYPSFLYGGNEQRYLFNPKGEIWIDHAVSCEEFQPTLMHELNERHLMAKFGWTYYQAHDSSLRLELKMRKTFATLCKVHEASLPRLPVTDYANIKEIKEIPDTIRLENIYRLFYDVVDGIQIWIVDGYQVRAHIYPDFGFSANDLTCHFIPPKEIWIDGQISCEETSYSVITELEVRKSMLLGKSFSDAYDQAIDHVVKKRQEMKLLIERHRLATIPDTLARDAGIMDPSEK